MGMTTEALDVVIDSTSDKRVNNNVARHKYRVLTDTEKADMKEIKDLGLQFIEKIYQISRDKDNFREFSIAEDRIEEAVMWAVKGLTK